MNYIIENALILIPVLYILGSFLKGLESIKDKYIPACPGMEILDCYNKVLYRITFDDLLFTGVSGLEFDFSSNEVDQKIVTTTWRANKVNVVLEPSRV